MVLVVFSMKNEGLGGARLRREAILELLETIVELQEAIVSVQGLKNIVLLGFSLKSEGFWGPRERFWGTKVCGVKRG